MLDVAVVEDRAVARMLTLGDGVAYLRPFVHQAASVAEAARDLREPIQRVHYRTQRLVALGLLVVVAIETRGGRPIKRYRASAYAYRIPAHVLPEQLFPLSEANRSAYMQRALEAARPELVHDGEIRITFPPDGPPNVDRLMGEGLVDMLGERAPAVLNTWRNLFLSAPEAKRLQRELWDVLLRYADQYSVPTHGRRHVIQLSMAPALPSNE